MIVTNILLLQVRHVTDRYQESKYVAFASMLMFEILIVGLPVMIAVKESPTATFIVLTGIIALDDIGILCFIFVPKIRFQVKGLEEGVGFGESIMKDTLKRASTRESIRSTSEFSTATMNLPKKTSPFANSLVNSLDSIIEDSIDEETFEELRGCEQMKDSDEGASHFNHLYYKDDDVEPKTPPMEEVRVKKRSIERYLANRKRVGSFRKKEDEEASEETLESTASPTMARLLIELEQMKQRLAETSIWSKGANENSPSIQVASEETPAKLIPLQMASSGTTSSVVGDVSEAPENNVTPADEAMPESGRDVEPEEDSASSPAVEYTEPLKENVMKNLLLHV
jgi:hypothetical protein